MALVSQYQCPIHCTRILICHTYNLYVVWPATDNIATIELYRLAQYRQTYSRMLTFIYMCTYACMCVKWLSPIRFSVQKDFHQNWFAGILCDLPLSVEVLLKDMISGSLCCRQRCILVGCNQRCNGISDSSFSNKSVHANYTSANFRVQVWKM